MVDVVGVVVGGVVGGGGEWMKSEMKRVVKEMGVGVLVGVMVMGVGVGIGKKWRVMNEEKREGKKKEGWMKVG